MNKEEIDKVIKPYINSFDPLEWERLTGLDTQYDNRSATINYGLVRHFKPKVVLEFGTRKGRCTHDILKALTENGGKYIFKPYELSDTDRASTQTMIDQKFATITTVGGDVTKAEDIPEGIDYLFVDNFHDLTTTKWVFDELLKKCKPGALVHFHDVCFEGDYEITKPHSSWGEMDYIVELHKEGKLPLEKFYWGWEHEKPIESAWWIYKPIERRDE